MKYLDALLKIPIILLYFKLKIGAKVPFEFILQDNEISYLLIYLIIPYDTEISLSVLL